MGGRKSYNPKNKGKKSYQPMLTFVAETREYLWGGLRNGDRPTGKQIQDHIEQATRALRASVSQIFARADSGFYCAEAVEAYEAAHCQFVISARKTSRLVEQLEHADWTPSPKTDADSECELRYQPEGWTHAAVSWRFATRNRSKRPTRMRSSNINCSKRVHIATACSSPT